MTSCLCTSICTCRWCVVMCEATRDHAQRSFHQFSSTGADPGFEKGGEHRSRVAKIEKLMIFMKWLL